LNKTRHGFIEENMLTAQGRMRPNCVVLLTDPFVVRKRYQEGFLHERDNWISRGRFSMGRIFVSEGKHGVPVRTPTVFCKGGGLQKAIATPCLNGGGNDPFPMDFVLVCPENHAPVNDGAKEMSVHGKRPEVVSHVDCRTSVEQFFVVGNVAEIGIEHVVLVEGPQLFIGCHFL